MHSYNLLLTCMMDSIFSSLRKSVILEEFQPDRIVTILAKKKKSVEKSVKAE